jgi:hypothetical protein
MHHDYSILNNLILLFYYELIITKSFDHYYDRVRAHDLGLVVRGKL